VTTMNDTTTTSKRAAIAEQIKNALIANGPMTSPDLVPLCPDAVDSTAVGRIMADLYMKKAVSLVGSVMSNTPGQGSRLIKQWAWVGTNGTAPDPRGNGATSVSMPADAQPTVIPPMPEESPAPTVPAAAQPEFHSALGDWLENDRGARGDDDGTIHYAEPDLFDEPDLPRDVEYALAALVDQADEAVKAMAGELLADHDGYQRLCRIAEDAFQSLCDYRASA
jgi:hypothetical protein